MLFKKSRSEKVADKAHDLIDTVKGKIEDSDALSTVKDTVSDKASSLRDAVKDVDTDALKDTATTAKDKAATGGSKVAAFGAPAADKVASSVQDSDRVSTARDAVTDAAGTTKEQASSLFNDEVMPRWQEAVAALVAGTSTAVAKLPEPAQEQVARVAPELVRRKRGGKLLIGLGVAALAGAGYYYWQGQQKKKSSSGGSSSTSVHAVGEPAPAVDDAVADVERKANSLLSGSDDIPKAGETKPLD